MLNALAGFASDNDSYRFADSSAVSHCHVCGYVFDRRFVDPSFRLKRRNYDCSVTYDGAFIASQRFRDLSVRIGNPNLEFQNLPNDQGFWLMTVVGASIPFDSIRRQTRFENKCASCETWESVIGAVPAYLQIAGPLPPGIHRTDLEFGSGNEKSPLLLFAAETVVLLKRENIRGLHFESCEG